MKMQAPTHLVMGILIQKVLRKIRPLNLQYFLIAFLAIMSHGVLDKIAKFTYHPSSPLFGDWFWVLYHLILTFLTILIFIRCWKKYKIGLFFPSFLTLIGLFFTFPIYFHFLSGINQFFMNYFLDSLIYYLHLVFYAFFQIGV
jgi:hypothetical protein